MTGQQGTGHGGIRLYHHRRRIGRLCACWQAVGWWPSQCAVAWGRAIGPAFLGTDADRLWQPVSW